MEMDSGDKWSKLPQDLLRMIGKFIDTRISCVRFRAVCSSWRSSSVPAPVVYLQLPFPSSDSSDMPKSGHVPLVKRTIYRIEPCEENPNPWTLFEDSAPWKNGAFLFQVEEEEAAQGMRLLTPLRGDPIDPPLDPEGLNYLCSGLSEICSYYYYNSRINFLHEPLRKVLVSCSDPVFMGNNRDYAVMAMDIYFSDVRGILYFYNSGEEKWNCLYEESESESESESEPDGKYYWSDEMDINRCSTSFTDLITHKGKFYALHVRGRTMVIDPLTKKVTEITPYFWPHNHAYKQLHLVESLGGDLLMVDREYESGDNWEILDMFKVFKLLIQGDKEEEEVYKWVEIKSLPGDEALFVNNNVSFSFSARDYVGYKANCIYYYSGSDFHFDEDLRDILTMFNLEDGTPHPLQEDDFY